MIALIISLIVTLVILLVSEYGWRHKLLLGERARKFVHILVGTFVAFWPWFLSWRQIQLVSLAFLISVVFNRRYKIFHALFSVSRRSYGEITFAVAVGASALVTTNKIYFMIGMLHLALADGVAALVGRNADKKWRYNVFGQSKTVIGSMSFWLVSVWILGLGLALSGSLAYSHITVVLLIIPPIATAIENLLPFGLDNLGLSLGVIGLLTLLA